MATVVHAAYPIPHKWDWLQETKKYRQRKKNHWVSLFFVHRVTVLSTQSKPSKGSTCSCTELRPGDSAWILGCPLLHYMGETPTASHEPFFSSISRITCNTQLCANALFMSVAQELDECFIQTERESEKEKRREEWKLFEGRDQSLGILIQGPRKARMGGLLLVGWSTEKPGSMWLTTFCLKPRNKNTHPFCSMFVAAPFPCHWHLQLNCLLEALQAERPRGWLQETKFLVGTTCCKVPPPFGWAKQKETAEFHMSFGDDTSSLFRSGKSWRSMVLKVYDQSSCTKWIEGHLVGLKSRTF